MSPANDRRRGNRGLMAALVMAVFIGIGANAVVMGLVAEQAEKAERSNKRLELVAADVLSLVKQSQPCQPKEPKSPACVRKAASDRVVADAIASINASLAAGLSAHDANASAQHDALRARLGVRSALPPRTPITAAPRTTTASTSPTPATTTTTAPANPPPETATASTTTTTTCETLPNGKCRR